MKIAWAQPSELQTMLNRMAEAQNLHFEVMSRPINIPDTVPGDWYYRAELKGTDLICGDTIDSSRVDPYEIVKDMARAFRRAVAMGRDRA